MHVGEATVGMRTVSPATRAAAAIKITGKVTCQLPGAALPHRKDAMSHPHQPGLGEGEEQIGALAILTEVGLIGEGIRRPEAPTHLGRRLVQITVDTRIIHRSLRSGMFVT